MSDKSKTDPAAKDKGRPQRPVVDFDAGDSFGAFELPLQRPFKLDGKVYETLSIREPTGEDVDRHIAGRDPKSEFFGLVRDLAGIDDKAMGRMHASDRAALFGLVGEFIGDTLPSSR